MTAWPRIAGRGDREGGIAYLLLMIVLAGTGAVLAALLPAPRPVSATTARAAEDRLWTVRQSVVRARREQGAFPSGLDALAQQTGLEVAGTWRRDPFTGSADLRYRRRGRPSTVTVQSRGADGRYGTTDDPMFAVDDQVAGRADSRNRLRLLRAQLVAWQATAGSSAYGPTEHDQLRAAVRDYAAALRRYALAGAAERAALDAAMAAALATIRQLRLDHGVAFPTRVTGSTGLMAAIGWPDSAAVDDWGRVLSWDEAVGVRSRGGDRRGGTSDDF